MKKTRRLFYVVLIALVAALAWSPASQAAYTSNYQITVDHTRVAGLDGTPPTGFGYLKSITIDHSQVAGSSVTPPAGFGYVKKITIDNTKVSGASDLTNFPVLVSIQNDALLKTTGNDGRVTDAEGDDIVFYAADLTTVLDYEVEQYDGTTGTLVAWVRLPVLSFALDTVFYLAYGNGTISSPQAVASDVWDSNFVGVWHLEEQVTDGDSTGTHDDSTGTTDGTQHENGPIAGRIAGGQDFDGGSEYVAIDNAGNDINTTQGSVSAWTKLDAMADWGYVFCARVDLDNRIDLRWDDANGFFDLKYEAGNVRQEINTLAVSDSDGQERFVTITWDTSAGASGEVKGYVDGSQVDTTRTGLGTWAGSITEVKIGTNCYGGQSVDGMLDEVRISNIARSAAWIATEYNNQSNPSGFMTIEDSGALTDFPVLVSIHNDATIKHTDHPGGRLTDLQGDDLRFYAADLTTKLDYEVEQYDGATGTLVAWVRMPALANDEDTVFYLAYGNNGISEARVNALGVWDSNFKGVWHLEEEAPDDHDDSSGTNDGTRNGNVETSGKIAGGQDFGGGSAVIVPSLNIVEEHTLSGWVYPQNLQGTVETYFRIAGSTYIRHDGINSQGQVHFYIVTDGSNRHLRVNGQLEDDTWYYLAGTWDGTSQVLYINGQLADSQQPGGDLDDPTSAYTIGVPTGSPPDAVMDEVRYADTARSAAWIATEYNNQSNPGGFMTIQDAGPLDNFPVLVSIQNDAQLKTTPNGQVTHAQGWDIIFKDADGIQLDHEVESYDGASGTLVAWVNIPALAVAQDTIFYLHYGDDTVMAPTENPAGVWDDYYRGVWHLAEPVAHNTTGGIHVDSTGVNNGTQNKNGTIAGQIAGAQYFDGNGDYVDIGNPLSGAATGTISAWVYHDSLPASTERYVSIGSSMFIRHDGTNSVGQLHFGVNTAVGDYQALRINGALTTGNWYHVAGTWNGKTQRVYLDGQLLDSQTLSGTLPASTDSYISNIAAEEMDGRIDEARVSDMARPGDWIITTYNNQRWPNKAQHPAEGFITVTRSVCQAAVPVTCGSITDGLIETPGAWDSFEVTLGSADSWLEIYTTPPTFDTYGHLYDENCVEIAQDDTVDYNFNISQTATPGSTYYVQVRHASESGTGAYKLVAECSDDDHGDSIDEATPIDCGSPAVGTIDSAGDKDYFKVVFWGTGVLTAYTDGDTDTVGTLLDDGGGTIEGPVDSGGGGGNFLIQPAGTVDPGVYYVVVGGNESGDYSLQVDCEYTPVITATAEYGGTICKKDSSPCEFGAVGVPYGTDVEFTITADDGGPPRNVWVDGEWIGAVTQHKFDHVIKDQKIVAVFDADFENCVDIPDIPLDAWYKSAPANVMFVLDDSGSMDWEFMTSGGDGLFDDYYRYVFENPPGDNLYGRELPADQRLKWQSQWAGHNKLYYDPAVEYQPWPNHEATTAQTLAQAHSDTPLTHPTEPGAGTYNLNETYVQYTSDTGASAIIVNDHDVTGFSKTPDAAGAGTQISTGFEGAVWDDGFDFHGPTAWNKDSTILAHGGTYSALASKNAGGDLISDDLDASDLSGSNPGDSITVEFWFQKDGIESGEFMLSYHDGGDHYDPIADLDNYEPTSGPARADGVWLHYEHTITDPQYFISDFRIKLYSTFSAGNEYVWVDDVVIRKNGVAIGWLAVTDDGEAHEGDYWWTAADGAYTATWTPDIPAAGNYDVYARWHAADNRSETVPYTVTHKSEDGLATVTTTVTKNQRLNGGSWVWLGEYPFDAGSGGNVKITYTRSGDDDRVCADAVKFAPAGTIDAIDIPRAHYYVRSESEDKPYLVVLDGDDKDIYYYAVNDAVDHGGDGDNNIDPGELAPAPSPPSDVQTVRLYGDERQNFANWYQYYRRRELTATAAVASVIAGLKGVQVGFYSINGNLVHPAVPVKSAGIDKSKKLLQALYDLKLKMQGTPLRRGLREVGKYFADSSQMIGSSPYATVDNGGACQQAFAIVMTDGFWNGKSPAVGNADGNDDTAYDGGGYADIYPQTLADVAMKYYETDLHSGLDDNVPDSVLDPATHQHMVTYTVSFGRTGSLNPDDYDIANGQYPVWPDPRHVSVNKIDDLWHAAVNGRGEFLSAASPTELIDSLLAITRSIESRIASSSSVSVNGDPLYQELTDSTRMYQATYRSDSWVGDVSAYRLDADSGEVADLPEWTAADRLEAVLAAVGHTGRIIATYNGTQGIPFRYDRTKLSASQQWALGSDLVANSAAEQNAANILNYVRGERSNEAQYSGTFRDRFQVLGDIVHSSPVYHNGMLYAGGNDGMLHAFDAATGDEKFAYVPKIVFGNLSALVDPDYSHKYFVDLSPTIRDGNFGNGIETILVGGLGKGGKGYYALDVTNAAAISTEAELADRVLWEYSQGYLAYKNRTAAPLAVGDEIGKLPISPDLPVEAEVAAILPADSGAGTGLLDLIRVAGPGSFQDGDDLLLFTSGTPKVAEVDGELYDPYMGYSYSRPVIAKSNRNAAEWLAIFGNGYNSAKSHAVLYILNVQTGALIKRIDTEVGSCNGLSSPIAIDIDANGTADYVYAGDLQGNLWKFDLSDTDAANWAVAYKDPDGKPAPVFQAKTLSGSSQPITSKPDVMYHCNRELPGYLVVFGTGQYLEERDLESTSSSSIYGIWDYGDDDDDSEYLGSFERDNTPQLLNDHLKDVDTWKKPVKLRDQTVDSSTWTSTDDQTLRVITNNPVTWGTVDDDDTGQNPDPGSETDTDTVHAGWYFDLPNPGEMAVSDVIIRDGKVLVISFTPGKDPCGSGGTSIFQALDACTGGRASISFFVNIDAVKLDGTEIGRGSNDWKEPSGIEFAGRLQPPVILRKGNLEYHYLSSSTGDVHKQEAAGTRLGIFYWLQIE